LDISAHVWKPWSSLFDGKEWKVIYLSSSETMDIEMHGGN
jgi:hypothetical protein